MSHYLIRATIVPEIVKMIAGHEEIDESEALEKFYSSATGQSLADDATGLYGQSILYIYNLYLAEQQFKSHPPTGITRRD